MKIIITIASMLLIALLSITVRANSQSAELCEKKWQLESSDTSNNGLPNYENLLEKWKSYHEVCNGTVTYEARLALIYVSLNKVSKARDILNSANSESSPKYGYLLDLTSLHADAVELDMQGQLLDTENLSKLEKKHLDFTKKYPKASEGFALLGNTQSLLGKHNEAIKSLEISLNQLANKWGIHRNLAISYTAVSKYKKAFQSANLAYELNKHLLSDPDFVFALVKTNAALGDYKSAQSGLKVIAARRPEVKNSAEFAEAANFLINEIDKKLEQK